MLQLDAKVAAGHSTRRTRLHHDHVEGLSLHRDKIGEKVLQGVAAKAGGKAVQRVVDGLRRHAFVCLAFLIVVFVGIAPTSTSHAELGLLLLNCRHYEKVVLKYCLSSLQTVLVGAFKNSN